MDSLNFENVFNKEKGNIGDLFQSFVFELLRKSDYPKLHKFSTAGKDGGIDLIQQLNKKRTVVECKYIGKNDISEAKNRWKEVKRHLETHLANPIPKEKQYKPWINSAKPIVSYLFCVSSEVSNQNGFDEFEREITDFFKSLASSHLHLQHLKTIEVEIIDWNKLLQKLDDFPQLKFRWFPLAEKFGFIPIQNKPAVASFRSFLEEDSLPFYNRSKHLEKEPNAYIQNEEQLLEMLEDTDLHGLIITGNGGAGKTRLTLELGHLAYKQDWLVFRCKETVNADNLNKFAETIADETKVLLLMDYVETQKHFTEITEQLQTLNNDSAFQIKYVANCRSSYYPTIRLIPNHLQVSLTSSAGSKKTDDLWLEQYQASVVRHILEQGGIQIEEKHLAVCKNKPILAVFLLYLHQKSQGEELENLLHGADFGKWIHKRTKMSFVNVTDFEMKLAKLAAILPFSEDICNEFDEFNSKLLGILANDGWIEKFQNNEWRSIHDVFADQIILSYTQDNPHFVEKFVRDIFSFAYSTNCLESAFISAQRLSPYIEVDFNKLLNAEIDKELPQWKNIRNHLLETSLLQEGQKLDLLSNETLWDNAEKDNAFQTSLGTIIKRTVVNSDSLTDTQLSIAKNWLHKTLPCISANNFLLRWAIKFSPEDMRDLALDRMRLYSSDFHTHYIYWAWLDSQLPPVEISEYFGLWLDKHQTDYEAGYVYQFWLDAKGGTEVVKKYLNKWLDKHQTALGSRSIYISWLKAKGEPDFIKGHLKEWLDKHQTTPQADFVIVAWLRANGETEIVKEHLGEWLVEHGTSFNADFIYRSWLDAKGETEVVKKYLNKWLDKHQTALGSRSIYISWLEAEGDTDFIREPLKEWLAEHKTAFNANFVYKSWLKAKGEPDFIKEPLQLWLAEYQTNFIAKGFYTAWLHDKVDIEFIKEPLGKWLIEHGISVEAAIIYAAWLDATRDFDYIKEFAVNWLAKHYDKQDANSLIKRIGRQPNLPDVTIYHIVHWCFAFDKSKDAISNLISLKVDVINIEISEIFIAASERIIESLLLNDSIYLRIRGKIMTVFLHLFLHKGLQDFNSIERIEKLYVKWLKHSDAFRKNSPPFGFAQEPIFLERFAILLEKNLLSIDTDRSAIMRFLRHFKYWYPDKKQRLQPIIRDLQTKYPSDVWDIVTFS